LLHLGFHSAAQLFETLPGISLWYPPAGLALALVTTLGWRAVPVVLAANLCSGLLDTAHDPSWLQGALPLLVGTVYSLAGGLIRQCCGAIPRPTKPIETGVVLGLLLVAPAVAASAGALTLWLAGVLQPGTIWHLLGSWWLGDFTGVITIVPLCFVHLTPRLVEAEPPLRAPRSWRRTAAIAGEAVFLLGCVWLVHGVEAIRTEQAYYLCFVPLALICLRHGLPGATIATCTLTMSSLAALDLYGGARTSLHDIAFFVICVSVIGLGLGWAVSRRARAEAERARLLEILEATNDFVGTCDRDARITYANSAYLRMRGISRFDDLRGTDAQHIYPAWIVNQIFDQAVPAAMRDGLWHGESALLDRDGNEVPVSQVIVAHFGPDGQPVAVSSVARDISEQKKAERVRLQAERNLLQAQKLESLGVLAGGIAHDFNNLLSVMLGNATLARLDLPPHSPAEQAVHQIELAALRAAELCRQMLTYSGKGGLALERVDLSTVVEQTVQLLKISIAPKCVLQLDLARELPPVHGDATQLSQVAMNLVMNASDASRACGGRITVRTGSMEADRDYLAATYLPLNAEPGRYVFLEVRDEGCGMTPDVLHRLFEPFFTTKYTGHGLGLSAVLGIVRSHRGAFKIDSEPNHGSTFRVLFPAATGTVAAPRQAVPIENWRGSGRVLVVDDEEAVRQIACRILGRFGFDAAAAFDGRDAVEMFRRHPDEFRAVLMDLSMPGMDGREACSEIHHIRPSIPVLLMSGYNHLDFADPAANEGFAGFVQKPFEAAHLATLLRSVLEQPSAGPNAPESESSAASGEGEPVLKRN
jgi:PAS domain S-box-containing protein